MRGPNGWLSPRCAGYQDGHGRLQGCIAFRCRWQHRDSGITYDFFKNIMHTIAQFGAAFEPV